MRHFTSVGSEARAEPKVADECIPLICVRRLLMSAGLAPVIEHEELLFLIESFVHQPRGEGGIPHPGGARALGLLIFMDFHEYSLTFIRFH